MKDKRRTTADLIAELDTNASSYDKAALIVGFESSTIYIEADNPKRLALLNEAVENGGEPVGWYGIDHDAGKIEMGLLDEHAEDLWAQKYLAALSQILEAGLQAGGN